MRQKKSLKLDNPQEVGLILDFIERSKEAYKSQVAKIAY